MVLYDPWIFSVSQLIPLLQVLMKNCLEQVTSVILKSFQDPHSRVCCAAFNFMQLPIILIEAMQILHHLRIVPALVTALDQHSIPRVKVWVMNLLCVMLFGD